MHSRIIVLIIIVLMLTGAGEVWNPNTYAVVNPYGGEWKAESTFMTIQAAVDSGASEIRVMAGEYPESVTLSHPLTLTCDDGAVLVNDGAGVSVWITSKGVTIEGCTIAGTHDGNPNIGDFWTGTGVHDTAGQTRIDGLKTVNLRGFAYVNATSGANDVILENFDFRNVGTVRDEHKCVQYAVLFMGASEGHTVRNGYISGASEGIGLWYGVSHTTVQGNRLIDNYGWVGGDCNGTRSAIEDYGLGRGNTGNRFLDNYIDGANSNGFELADVLLDTLVSRNTTRNTYGGAFGVWGSALNRGVNMRIEGNTFYGLGGGVWDKSNMFGGDGVIEGNRFIGYLENNTGAILIPSQEVGTQTVRNNEFIDSGLVARVVTDGTLFEGNRATVTQYTQAVYIDPAVTGLNTLRGNNFEVYGGNAIHAPYSPIRAEDNTLLGSSINGAAGSIVRGNDITIPACDWVGLMVQSDGIYADNIVRCDAIPMMVPGATDRALVERNFVTKVDGSAAPVPTCSGTNTCAGNWTAGQTPPP